MRRVLFKEALLIAFILFLTLFPSQPSGEGVVLAEKEFHEEYTAISYNIHRGISTDGEPSLKQIVHFLKSENPDFIALQEVDRYRFRSGVQDQIKEIAYALNMEYVFAPNLKNGFAQYGNGILSRYPILEWGKVELANEDEPRSLLWAKVMTEKGNLVLTSIHLGLDREERKNHFERIESFVMKVKDPILIMGDFNILPDHPLMVHFYQKITESSTPLISVPTYYHHDAEKEVQIDYIFGRKIWEVSCESIPSYASDHYPLIYRFYIGGFPFDQAHGGIRA